MTIAAVDRLIFENIADLGAASRRIEQLIDLVWEANAKVIERWSSEVGWSCEASIEGELKAWPQAWKRDGEAMAWFRFDLGPSQDGGDEAPYWQLDHLVGSEGADMVLWLDHNGRAIPFKTAARAKAETVRPAFTLTDRSKFYTDCTPDHRSMIEAAESADFSGALDVTRKALDRALAAQDAFTAILREANVL